MRLSFALFKGRDTGGVPLFDARLSAFRFDKGGHD